MWLWGSVELQPLKYITSLLNKGFQISFTKCFKWTGYKQMKLELVRTKLTEHSLTGKLSIDGVFQCYFLERPYNDPEHPPIPEGEYPVRMRDSAFWAQHGFKQVPGIFDVPGRTDIEIHPANRASELKGCVHAGSISECKEYFVTGMTKAEIHKRYTNEHYCTYEFIDQKWIKIGR